MNLEQTQLKHLEQTDRACADNDCIGLYRRRLWRFGRDGFLVQKTSPWRSAADGCAN
jgi:hypothetical protein